jgi:hypothetical protein
MDPIKISERERKVLTVLAAHYEHGNTALYSRFMAKETGLYAPPRKLVIHAPAPRILPPWCPKGMDTSEAGRLGALATNKKLTKKQRKTNTRKAAKARWAKKKV